jgi:hypothetical protein
MAQECEDSAPKILDILKTYHLANRDGYFDNLEKAEKLSWEKVSDFLDSTSAEKKFSAKNLARLSNQMFDFKVGANAHCFAKVDKLNPKWFLKPNSIKHQPVVRRLLVDWVGTPRGRIYGVKINNYPFAILCVSHVFDRFSQRSFNNELGRIKAIGNLFWDLLPKGGLIHTDDNLDTIMFTACGGAILGHGAEVLGNEMVNLTAASFSRPKDSDSFSILVFKTYVSSLRSNQLRLKSTLTDSHKWSLSHNVKFSTQREADKTRLVLPGLS